MKKIYQRIISVVSLALANTLLGSITQINEQYYNTSLPFYSCLINYTCMSLLIFFKSNQTDSKTNIWFIFLSGISDAVGCFLLVASYQYTTISSVTIILSMCVTFGMLFSYLISRVHYSQYQVLFCILSVIFSIAFSCSDLHNTRLVGDIFTFIATVLFGVSSALIEKYIGARTQVDYLSKMGLPAAALALTCTWIFDEKVIYVCGYEALLLGTAFGVLDFFYMIYGIYVVKSQGAVCFLLVNVLTPVFSIFVDYFIFGGQIRWWQLAFGVLIIASISGYIVSTEAVERNLKNSQSN